MVMAVQKTFRRIVDDGRDTLTLSGYTIDKDNNIMSFVANGVHYHFQKHQTKTSIVASATAAMAAGGTGAHFVSPKGPKVMLMGAAAVGSLVFWLGEKAFEHFSHYVQSSPEEDHEELVWTYADEHNLEIYWAPVSG
jgi:hypothetical protein